MNPCPKCQSYGKCTGTCWMLDLCKTSESIDVEMQTPEYANMLKCTIPYIGLMRLNSSDEEMYWRRKRFEEWFNGVVT